MHRASAGVVRMGVVGLGYWGPNLVRNVVDSPRAACLAVRLDPRALLPLGRRYPNARRTADYAEIRPKLDAVLIATRSRRTTRSRQPLSRREARLDREAVRASSSADALDLAAPSAQESCCCRATRSCTARRS